VYEMLHKHGSERPTNLSQKTVSEMAKSHLLKYQNVRKSITNYDND